MAARFETPRVNPFQIPQRIGTDAISSRYLFNNYHIEWDPASWRRAIDRAIQYSDLTYLDTLYSWCLQSSPFLVSQINKRVIPIYKRNFALGKNGKVNKTLTEKYITNSWWFKKFMRYTVLSQFYGVKLISIDPRAQVVTDFPLRNIDIFNEALRFMTYEYYSVKPVVDCDDLFFFQPETDQDFRLGMLQSISRAMIGIVEAFVNWSILGKMYSRPFTTLGYDANNAEAANIAQLTAQNIDMMTIPIIPFAQDYQQSGKSLYSVEVNSMPTQASPDAFRVFKEYVIEYRSEIMQLVTGGTLLGSTEKNTNSEQLAEIHMELYRDILDADSKSSINIYNRNQNRRKLAILFDDLALEDNELFEIPDKTVSQKLFVNVGEMLAKQKGRYKAETFEKVGLAADDVDFSTADAEVKTKKQSILGRVFGRKTQSEAPADAISEDSDQNNEN